MANKQDFIVKNGLTVLSTDISTGTQTGAIISQGGAGIAGDVNIGGILRAGQNNFSAYDPNLWYVSDSTSASDTNEGHSIFSSFKTIKHALSVAQSGDTVYIDPGVYTEVFPLTIPQGVSVRGAGLRETTVQPTIGTKYNDAFLLNGESSISDFNVTGFYKPGWAFKFAPGAKITTKSPYIQRFSVITRGTGAGPGDPYGFNTADAGNGAYLDAGVLDPTSLEPSLLFNEATFIVPNATGLYMTNGARTELINAFFYFADKAIYTEIGPLGYGGVGRTKIRVANITGTFTPGDTLVYKNSTGTTVASGTIASVSGDYIYITGPSWGFQTDYDAGTGTQSIYSTGVSPATATSILLADYHEFGAEIRSIGSAAVFGNSGVTAIGTGTDLKLIAFNVSHIGAGGDLSTDASLVNQSAEIIQVAGGKIYFQTVDQSGDFRVGSAFTVNQRTGNVNFGTATVSLASLPSLDITDGINHSYITPTSIATGNLSLSGNSLISTTGNIVIDPTGPLLVLNSDTQVNGAFSATNTIRASSTLNATSTNTGALQVAGGIGVNKDIWLGGSINVRGSATIVDLFVTGNAVIPGGFTATSFTSTELTVVGPAVLNQLTAALTTLTSLTVTTDATVQGTLTATTGTFNTGSFSTLIITSNTNATSPTTGALQVVGGVGIGQNLYVGGSTYLQGDLYVDGDQFIVSATNLLIADKTLTLSSTATSAGIAINSGVIVGTGTGYVSFLFDGSSSWKSKGSIIPNGTANIGSNGNPWNIIYGNTVYDNLNRVVTSVTPTAGLGIAITGLTSIGPAAQFAVTNTGVLSVIGGTDTSVSSAAGNVTVWNTANLQSVTGRGAATSNAIQITNNTAAISQTTGSLVVTGGVGIGGALYAGNIISNGSAVWTTATLTNNNQLSNGANYLTSSTLGEYGVSSITAGVGIRVSGSTGSVTVTNIGVVSLAGSQYIGLSASSGSGVTIYNLGVQQITTGSGISISTSTGTVNIASVDTLQLVTARGATTNQAIAFTSTNLSASTSSGQALLVSGGIGALAVYATNLFDGGNRVLTSVTPTAGTAISITAVSTSGPNTTFTVNNTGVTATIGTTYLGVSGSNGAVTFTNLGVQTLTAGTDTAVSQSTGTVTVWNASTLQSVTGRGATSNNAITITNGTNSTSTNTGALNVAGGVGINQDLYVGGSVTIIGTLNATTVVGAISTATNLGGGTTGSIPYQTSAGVTKFIGIGAQGQLLQVGASNSATWVTTGSILVGAAQFAVTATNVDSGFVNATTGRFSGITTVTNVTQSISTTTGALQVAGGAGVGGNLTVGGTVTSTGTISGSAVYDNSNRVITSVTPTGATGIGISNLTSSGPSASFTITNLGVTSAAGSTYLGVSASTGSVTFTNLGVQTITGSTYLGTSAATGTITLTNLGVQSLTAGTDTAVSSTTGTVTVWDISTLQSVTGRGATTNNAISITNATGSSTSTAGALTVSGGVGIGQNLNVGNNLTVFGKTTFADSVTFSGTATFVLSTNTVYTDNLLELHASPAGATVPWTFDDGKDIGLRLHYYNRALNTGTSAALIMADDTQWLEWYSSGVENVSGYIANGIYGKFKLGAVQLVDTTVANSTLTGALQVAGGVGVGGALYVGGSIFSGGNQVITSANLGSFGVSSIAAGPYISISPASGTGTVTIGNMGVQFISAGSGIAVSTSTGSVIIASSDTLQLVTNRGTTTSNPIQFTSSLAASAANTGAVVVTGGVGVGGGLYVTGASTFVGNITGYITTASNILGGTAGALIYQQSGGNTQFVGLGGNGSLLRSNGTNPEYVTTQSLLVGYAQQASSATNIAGGTAGQVAYQFSPGITGFIGGVGSGGNVLVSNGASSPSFNNTLTLAGTTNASSTVTGAFQVAGGAGIGRDLVVGGSITANGSQVVTAANLGLFGVAQIVAGTAIGVNPNSGTGTVTITNLGVQSLSTVTNGGLVVSTATGTVIIQSIDTFQLVTARNPSTNQAIQITNNSLGSNTTTGQALTVSGGIGALSVYATTVFDSGNRVLTSVVPSSTAGISITSVSTSNGQFAFTVNNTGVTSAIGTTYLGVSTSSGAVTFTNLGVQQITTGSGIVVSAATGTVNIQSIDTLQLVTNRGSTTSNVINITNVTSATTTTNGALIVAGGVGVLGDIYARNIYTNGQIVGGQSSTSSNLAGGVAGDIVYQTAPGVTGFVNIGTSGQILYSNGVRPVWTNSGALLAGVAVTATNIAGGLAGYIPIQSANSTTSFINSGTVGQLLQMGTNTATWVTTTTLYVGAALYAGTATNVAGGSIGQLVYQSNTGTTGFVNQGITGQVLVSQGSAAPVYQNTLTLAGNVQATSTQSGALVVAGGVGIGGNVWVGGTLYATVFGSISTATNIAGGAQGSIPIQRATGVTDFIPIGINGSVLYSNGTTASYISTTTLVVGAADKAQASSNLSGGALGSLPYQTSANTTNFIGIGNPGQLLQVGISNTATWVNTATLLVGTAQLATSATNIAGGSVGAIHYQSAVGKTEFIGITAGTAGFLLQSNGTTATWYSTSTLLAGSTVNINGGATGSIPIQSSAGVTSFIAIGANGNASNGATLLQSNGTTATFVNTSSLMVGAALFANSSTLVADLAYNPTAGAGQLVYQAATNDTRFLSTGTAGMVLVSQPGAPVYQNTLTLAGTTVATSTQTGALVVAGGVGIGGDVRIGGVLYATVAGSINTATSLSGGTTGAIVYQTAPGVSGFLTVGTSGWLVGSNGTNPVYINTATILVGAALTAASVNNITAGAAGSIPIQRSAGVTDFIPIGANGSLLQSNGSTATWVSTGSLVAGTALKSINLNGGLANQVPYQSAPDTTAFSANLTFNGTALTVGGNITAAAFVPNNNTVPPMGMYGATNTLGFATNSTNRLYFDAAGNGGIATTTPRSTLDLNGTMRISGLFTATSVVTATSVNSAAFELDGGLAVGANVIIGGGWGATTTTNGTLQVTGGAGINGDVYARTIYSNSLDVVANATIMAVAFG